MRVDFLARSIFSALLCLSAFVTACVPSLAVNAVGPTWATKVILYNASNTDAVVLFNTGAVTQDGCYQDIRYVRYLDLSGSPAGAQPLTVFNNTQIGWFMLKRGHRAQVYSIGTDPFTHQATYCLDGNIGFQCLTAKCPLATMPFPNTTPGSKFNQDISKYVPQPAITLPPNGTNGFEFALNLPGKNNGKIAPGTPESLDITCVNGVSSKIQVSVTPPAGGPYWTYPGGPQSGGQVTYKTTTTIQNSWVHVVNGDPSKGCDDNCVDPKTGQARPGVFPYGCSVCNAFPDPKPPCGSKATPTTGNYASQFCAAKNLEPVTYSGSVEFGNGCQFNRTPYNTSQKFGGTVQVTYLGPLSPPASCP